MLDMSSSMPIFTTPSEILSWASATNGHATNSAALVVIIADLFIVSSQISALQQFTTDIARLVVPLFPQQRLGHLAQPHLLYFRTVRAIDDRERFHHHNPLRDLEPRQLFQASRPQTGLIHLHPGRRLNKSHRHRIAYLPRRRNNLYGRHARVRLNDSLDFLGADQKATETHGVANSRFIHEVPAGQAGEITGAEHAVRVERPFGCRWI